MRSSLVGSEMCIRDRSITPVCPLFLMSVCPLLLSVPYSFCLSFTPVCPLLLLSVSNPQIQQSVDLCRTSESEFRLWCVGVSLLVRLTCVQPHRRYQHDLWCRIRILKKSFHCVASELLNIVLVTDNYAGVLFVNKVSCFKRRLLTSRTTSAV